MIGGRMIVEQRRVPRGRGGAARDAETARRRLARSMRPPGPSTNGWRRSSGPSVPAWPTCRTMSAVTRRCLTNTARQRRGACDERRPAFVGLGHAHHEPPDLFERYLDPKFRHRVRGPSAPTPGAARHLRPRRSSTGWPAPATPTCSSTASGRGRRHPEHPAASARGWRHRGGGTSRSSKLRRRGPGDGMAMEGVDIAVLYPTNGLSLLAATTSIPSCRWRSARPTTTGSPSSAGTARAPEVRGHAAACTTLSLACTSWSEACASWRGRLVHPPQPRDGHYGTRTTGTRSTASRGAERDVGLPRGRARTTRTTTSSRRERLLPPRGQPLDRDASRR